ncbi:NAD(P)-dependent oxidoreductase [Nordella sp. HKS 07]|uniref:NAD(P)-dependent oxidoreductase n=1 Tax=Nordella sp. HKS 07 TaxID=2712222 RepID=UPI0013E14A7A|nr:NAD(P)-dependent oxidoreductase [Nordella sp. HKS 07]QIG47608.1 NAD(P)-dependent oxidoreductase [Nordella sp. HKS 07]
MGHPDIAGRRLPKDAYAKNFSDLHPPLSTHEALVESDRCYFCYDAPCQQACPTSIDIPLFIRQIGAGNPNGAAETIFEQNILGGMCARVCPTETLCEEACVREKAEGKPVKIGLLQRYATDTLMRSKEHPFQRAAATGKKVAVIGAGPAGLACAHRLALHGHDVTIFEARKKSGGLNEYGIAAYKTVDGFAQDEVDFILGIGGIAIEHGKALGKQIGLETLRKDYDAVFLGMGLQGVNALNTRHEESDGVEDAVDYIAELRQAKDLGKLAVGRKVLVIGGGMTAIDIAVQSKLLGAEDVTILYRRGAEQMKASGFEQELAQTKGVKIKHWVMPRKVLVKDGQAIGLECEYTEEKKGRLQGTGETFKLAADMIFKAIGQTFVPEPMKEAIVLDGGRIKVDASRRTSLPDVWAGGDCAAGGQDLTVAAVDDGRRAAEAIHSYLSA